MTTVQRGTRPNSELASLCTNRSGYGSGVVQSKHGTRIDLY